MKKLLYLFLLLPSVVFAQIQVSDITYEVPRDDYSRKGFMKIGEEEYFIEQGEVGTKVSQVLADSLVFLHELRFRPGDSQLNTTVFDDVNSNSRLIYDGPLLYEVYYDYIYVVNVLTAELEEVVNLESLGLTLQSRFFFGDNYFFFRTFATNYVRVDRTTGLVDELANSGLVVEDTQYWISADSTRLLYRDLSANEVFEHPFEFSKIGLLRQVDYDTSTLLMIEDAADVHRLRDDATIETVTCPLPANSTLGYISDDRLAYIADTGSDFILTVVDRADCSVQFTENYLYEPGTGGLQISGFEELFGEYFMMGYPSGWTGSGQFYMYDLANDSVAALDIVMDYAFPKRAVRYGDDFYFYGLIDLHTNGRWSEIYHLDLTSFETQRISPHELFQCRNIVMGEPQTDRELNLYYATAETSSLMQANEFADLDTIAIFDLLKNRGLPYSIYGSIWVENKYFFSTSDAIYVTENDETTKVFNLDKNAIRHSAHQKLGDHVFLLKGFPDDFCEAYKINTGDLTVQRISLPDVNRLFYERAKTDKTIVNLGSVSSQASPLGFFDLESEDFIGFEDLGLPSGQANFISNNIVLYVATPASAKMWYLVNVDTREVVEVALDEVTFPDVFPDGQGGFYLNDFDVSGDRTVFAYLDATGSITELYDGFNYESFREGDRFEGRVKSVALDGPEETIFISVRDGEVKQKRIFDNGRLYYQSFPWFESDRRSFVEMSMGTSYDTYTFTFESEPQKITPVSREDRLVLAISEETFAVLVYQDDENVLSFEYYDYETGEIDPAFEIPSNRFSAIELAPVELLDGKYLLSLHDGQQGAEPWILDVNAREVVLLADINEGIASSDIRDFTTNPRSKEVYFSARKTAGDRQLFKLDRLLTAVAEYDEQDVANLQIAPVPADTDIRLFTDISNVSIFTMDGKVMAEHQDYKSGTSISIEYLPTGTYILLAQYADGSSQAGKVVIAR